MRPRFWRIAVDAPDYGADDLTGEGARRTGGRWNRKGTGVLYCSSSISLACLETVVHVAGGAGLPLNRYLVEISIPQAAWKARTVFDPGKNAGWDARPTGAVSMDWGTNWAKSAASLVAVVPSVIVPEDWSVLMNPAHPDARKLAAKRVRRFDYDPRLLSSAP